MRRDLLLPGKRIGCWLSRSFCRLLFGFGFAPIFLEGSHALGADLHSDFGAVEINMGTLKIRLPHLVRLLLREGNVVAELFAFAANFTDVRHDYSLITLKQPQYRTRSGVLGQSGAPK